MDKRVRSIFSSIILLALACLLPACERTPDLTRAKAYHNAGLEFQYPGNWAMEGDFVSPEIITAMFKTPGESFVMLRSSLPGENDDLRAFASSFQAMPEEKARVPPLEDTTAPDGTPALESHHILHTMGTTVACTRVFRKKVVGGKTFFFLLQTTDHALPKIKPGFELIVKSLIYRRP